MLNGFAQLVTPPALRDLLHAESSEHIPAPQHDKSPRIDAPNGGTVRGRNLAHTYDPRRVALSLPAAVPAVAGVGGVNGLDFSASKKTIDSGAVIDTIIITVPKNGLYYGISLTSEIEYYIGGVLGANVCAMRSEFLLGVDAGYSILIPVNLKVWTVNIGLYSPTATTGPITDYCTVTFARRGHGRVDE